MKAYISFGQEHTHRINGQTYDCDSLMEVEGPDEFAIRLALNRTIKRWCGLYYEKDMHMFPKYFPRGVINKDKPIYICELEKENGT